MFAFPVQIGKQAGKIILTGSFTAAQAVELLREAKLSVNSKAQRSLVTGKNKDDTSELIANDKVLATPRVKNFTTFIRRVMDGVEKKEVAQGFFGAISLTVPEGVTGIRIEDRIDL